MVGTPQLFPSAPYLSDKARYKRGFTPERQESVRAGLGVDKPEPDRTKWMRREERNGGLSVVHQGVREKAQVDMVRNVARSTMPLEHLQGLSYASVEPPRVLGSDAAHGEYRSDIMGRRVLVAGGQEDTPTVIHELGHHVSSMQQTEHSQYDTPEQMGHEEAYAENYAERHFRDRRRQPLTAVRPSTNPSNWTFQGQRGGRHGGFHEGWSAERANGPIFQRHLERRQRLSLTGDRAERIAHQQTLW